MGLRKGERAIAGWGHNQNKAKYVSAAAASSARLFDTNSRVLVLCAPPTTQHPPPTHRLSFLRVHFWVAALSRSISLSPLSPPLSRFAYYQSLSRVSTLEAFGRARCPGESGKRK